MLVFLSAVAVSRQPGVVFDAKSSEKEPIEVGDPEISRAFYGELNGDPDFYRIDSDRPFRLYVNILLPDREGFLERDLHVNVTDSQGRMIVCLDGSNHVWEPFFRGVREGRLPAGSGGARGCRSGCLPDQGI
ncbi:MAG: hypothetical protein JW724_00920 [Candidatus Altiarchaeota archaeon]|nr:hypothetical protein [Candidatus Altiarchaeota archaeon]